MSGTTPKGDKVLPFKTRAEAKAKASELTGAGTQVAEASFYSRGTPTASLDGTTGEIWLYGLVGGWWSGFDAEGVADALRGMDVDQLVVRIHSPGGLASDGIAIGNLLRNYDAEVTVVVDGIAASAASIIALAGDRIVMCPGSQLMIHDAMTGAYGSAEEIRAVADWIDGQSANYASVYAGKAGGTTEHWRELMTANGRLGTWFSGDAAVEAGLADEVGTRIAIGSPPTSSDDSELEDDDTWALALHDLQLLENYVQPAACAAWRGEAPKPPNASAGGSPETKGGTAVAFSDEQIASLRSTLGLADDADEAAILAAAETVVDKATEPPPVEKTEAKAVVPEGMTLIEKDVLEGLREQGTQGAAARTQQLEEKRDGAIAKAISDGKITPARKDHWVKSWDADAEGTEAMLAGLEPGIVPVAERGHDQNSTSATSAYDELYGTKGA